ncbi:phage tail tape measure C-terminal domain-containing protein [Cohaesibacter celericrescens]|uniref:Bacteriophage tail tape measure C-terminal domain-containing protein n=1 Tax=Cohaesibacter celericrescens TaxID=2067669 RepID=A0A2N5XX54_9HYPH|nr:phage tail tape measure C-terminal domain-containing protein [Cohaesibacter celericrescens]PLW79069.1 hypothetical protein C0081_02225 [Cohaesibacter celericrescens]
MASNRDAGSVSIRLSVKDKAVVEKALKDFGKEGELALKKINTAGQPASAALKGVSAASGELRSTADGLTSRLGATGGVLRSIGPAGLVAGAAIGAAVVAFEAMRRAAINAAESLAELKGEAAIAGLDVEAFQEFEFMANKLGVSKDALVDGFKELQLRGQEFAQRGAGPAVEAFQELGYTQDDVAKKLKDAPVFFNEIIKKIGELDKAAQLIALDEVFGGAGGEQLVKFVNAGTDAMADMAREGRELGVVIDRHIVEKGAEASKQLKTLALVIDRNLDSALIDLAPLAITAAEGFAYLAQQVGAAIDKMRELEDRTSAGLQTQMSGNSARINELTSQIERDQAQNWTGQNAKRSNARIARLEAERRALIAENDEIVNIFKSRQTPESSSASPSAVPDELQETLSKRKQYLDNIYRAHLAATNQRVELINWERDQQIAALDAQGFSAEEKADARAKIEETASAKISALKGKEAKSTAKVSDAQREGESIMRSLMTASETYSDRIAELNKYLEAGAISQETYNRGVEEASRVFAQAEKQKLAESRMASDGMQRALEAYADGATNSAAQIEGVMGGALDGLESKLVDFVSTGKLEFGDLVDSIVADIARMTIQQNITGPLSQGLGGLLGAFNFSNLFGGSAAGSSLSIGHLFHSGGAVGRGSGVSRSVDSAVFSDAPRFHAGGNVSDGLRPGERAIVALENERILTAAQQTKTADTIRGLASLASRPQGGSVTITIHNNASGSEASAEATPNGNGGFDVTVMIEQVESQMGQNIAKGKGLAPVIESQYGLNRSAGAFR